MQEQHSLPEYFLLWFILQKCHYLRPLDMTRGLFLTQGPQYINITCSVYSCSSNFYGSQCEVDGEVLGVAVGASVAAVVIIVLTLVCLCMWRWVNTYFVTYSRVKDVVQPVSIHSETNVQFKEVSTDCQAS